MDRGRGVLPAGVDAAASAAGRVVAERGVAADAVDADAVVVVVVGAREAPPRAAWSSAKNEAGRGGGVVAGP